MFFPKRNVQWNCSVTVVSFRVLVVLDCPMWWHIRLWSVVQFSVCPEFSVVRNWISCVSWFAWFGTFRSLLTFLLYFTLGVMLDNKSNFFESNGCMCSISFHLKNAKYITWVLNGIVTAVWVKFISCIDTVQWFRVNYGERTKNVWCWLYWSAAITDPATSCYLKCVAFWYSQREFRLGIFCVVSQFLVP